MSLQLHGSKVRGGLVGLLWVLLPLAAASAPRQDTAQAHIQEARRFFENLEYERALEALDRAQRRARSDEDTISILLHEGIILAEMGKPQEATAAFNAALRLRPDAQLPLVVSPKIERQFTPLRQQAMKKAAQATAKPVPEPTPVPAPPPTTTARPESLSAAENVSDSGALGPRVLVPAITGGVLLVAGGISWGLARSEYSRLESNDPTLATLGDVDRSTSRGKTWQTVGFGLLGAGIVGLGIATGLYVTHAPEASVSLGVGTDGRSAFIQGRWP